MCIFPFWLNVPNNIIVEQIKIQKNLLWNLTAPKIKHSTTHMDYQNGRLENVIFFKMISLQCLLLKLLFENLFHQWEVILLFFINKMFGEHFKFHSNLDFSNGTVKCFPSFYKSMFPNWKNCFLCNSMFPFLHNRSGFIVWIEFFCGMVDQRKAFSLISSQDHI